MLKNIIKKLNILVSCALAASLLAGCGGEDAYTVPEQSNVQNGYVAEKILPLSSSAQADTVKKDMKLMLSTDEAELYLGEHYDIAVVDKRTGDVHFSNEAIYSQESDNFSTDSQKNAFSQLVIDYYRKDGAAVTVHSFPECYDGAEKDQVTAEVIGDTLSVTYSFGTVMESRVIFQVMTADTYKTLTEKAEKAVEEKTISSSGWGRVKSCYNHIVYDELSDTELKKYTATYPSFSSGDELYVLNPSATYIQTDNIEKVCKELGYTRADVDEEEEKVGGSASLESTIPNFVVTLEYSLDGADLLVGVNISDVVEPENFYIEKIYVLPCFGGTDTKDSGYLFLPNGTGSLIYNNADSSGSDTLSVSFYGSDPAEDIKSEGDLSDEAPFPVFGLRSGDSTVFAIVESGDALSGVSVHLANNNYPQNVVSPWFTYRVRGAIGDEAESLSTNYVYSKKAPTQSYKVRYHFLYGERSDYNGMAKYYRTYLSQTGALSDGESSFYVDVTAVGGIEATESVLGVSTTVTAAASDFASVSEWLSSVDSDKVSLNFEGLFNSGIDSAAPTKLKLVKALGDRGEYQAIKDTVALYPSLSFMQVAKGGNGISGNTDIAKFIDKEFAFLAPYEPHTGLRSEENQKFLITPAQFPRVGRKLTSAVSSFADTLLLSDAAILLYSDYNENRTVTREDAKLTVMQVLSSAKEQGLKLKLGGANAYALAYASSLWSVPSSVEQVKMIDETVPFLGMVLHGSLPYSASPLNEASDYESALLGMLENGANPSFRLITGDMSLLSDTEHTEFYAASAANWTDEVDALCEEIYAFCKATENATLDRHESLSDGLTRITYSNGYTAIINRSSSAKTVGGVRVDAKAYKLFDSRGEEL